MTLNFVCDRSAFSLYLISKPREHGYTHRHTHLLSALNKPLSPCCVPPHRDVDDDEEEKCERGDPTAHNQCHGRKLALGWIHALSGRKKMVGLELMECLKSPEFVFFSSSDSCSKISAVHKALAEEQGQLKVTQ